MKDYEIRNIGLAESGRMKIEWVKNNMPLLSAFHEEFSRTRPFEGVRISLSVHLEAKTAYLCKVLEAGGAEMAVTGSNILSTQDDIAAALAVDGMKVFAYHGATVDEYDRHIEMTLAHKPNIIIDDGGDLVGMVVAEFLGADAVVVPISCNDAIDRGALKAALEPKTRIGSPFVIAGMDRARAKGRRVVCGWEANGGFLLGSTLERDGRTLPALPTRDALLPILAVLFAAAEQQLPLTELFARLPRRFSRAALLRRFPRAASLKILQAFSVDDARIADAVFERDGLSLLDPERNPVPADEPLVERFQEIRARLGEFFTRAQGFGEVARLNYTDGVRVYFSNGDVAHVRPSGNADELRIYAVADSPERADTIARLGVAEPDGILRRMEQFTSRGP